MSIKDEKIDHHATNNYSADSSSCSCSCGRYYGIENSIDSQREKQQQQRQDQQEYNNNFSLDESFVHLFAPSAFLPFDGGNNKQLNNERADCCPSSGNNYLETHLHLEHLLKAATSYYRNNNDDDENITSDDNFPPVLLCEECLERVQNALDSDTERLETECLIYEQAINKEQQKVEALKKTLLKSIVGPDNNNNGHNDNVLAHDDVLQCTAQAYKDEIDALKEACKQQEEEYKHLLSLKDEQNAISQQLHDVDYMIEEERNSLELQARAFNNDQEQLHLQLIEMQNEMDKLSSTIPLPLVLFSLQVDKQRGLRYPLINQLRLAYRPKGDIQWDEIQASWSLAAQLLLVNGTMLNFQSQNWKIVPLTTCAKLMYFHDVNPSSTSSSSRQTPHNPQTKRRAVIYQLGHPIGKTQNTSKALLAWNALLYQIIAHAMKKQEEIVQNGIIDITNATANNIILNGNNDSNSNNINNNILLPKLPFPMTSSSIGNIRLTELHDNDDIHWSKAIHYMASNLLWLSECASFYTSQYVLSSSTILSTTI